MSFTGEGEPPRQLKNSAGGGREPVRAPDIAKEGGREVQGEEGRAGEGETPPRIKAERREKS